MDIYPLQTTDDAILAFRVTVFAVVFVIALVSVFVVLHIRKKRRDDDS